MSLPLRKPSLRADLLALRLVGGGGLDFPAPLLTDYEGTSMTAKCESIRQLPLRGFVKRLHRHVCVYARVCVLTCVHKYVVCD